ncbi:MAG: hypothetical protein HUU15_06080 [Candidatus Brocadiae bacterium]|nr:hypothetical protein [Candidatus Brocadiia bacterium]
MADTEASARRVILTWLGSKLPAPLPKSAFEGASFSLEEHGQVLQVVGIPDLGVWSSKLSQPDTPFKERKAVPGRTWTTELSIARTTDGVRFVGRVLCASLPFAEAPIEYTRPRVVIDLAENLNLRDVRKISRQPWVVTSEKDLAELLSLLVSPARTLPVYLLTPPDSAKLGLPVAQYLLDEVELAKRMQGLGVVVAMPKHLNPLWTAKVGRIWSAFMGAVRTYRPGLNFDQDSPTSHPLALADKVMAFDRNGLRAEAAFSDFLVERAFQEAASRSLEWAPCLSYADALRRESEQAGARADKAGSSIESLRKQVEAQTKRADEWEGIAGSFDTDVNSLSRELEGEKEDNSKLRRYIETLRAQLQGKTGKSPDSAIPIPSAYEELSPWVDRYLAGRLALHPRALRGLKDAAYKDVGLCYRALLCLAMEYRDMRLRSEGDDSPRLAWEKKLQELELKYDGSITKERAGQEGDTYFVKYPVGSERNQFLQFHLRKGKVKDDELCLAIYFFWDEEKQRVVVGWLPSHLENRLT